MTKVDLKKAFSVPQSVFKYPEAVLHCRELSPWTSGPVTEWRCRLEAPGSPMPRYGQSTPSRVRKRRCDSSGGSSR